MSELWPLGDGPKRLVACAKMEPPNLDRLASKFDHTVPSECSNLLAVQILRKTWSFSGLMKQLTSSRQRPPSAASPPSSGDYDRQFGYLSIHDLKHVTNAMQGLAFSSSPRSVINFSKLTLNCQHGSLILHLIFVKTAPQRGRTKTAPRI
jgi:hypothetical protein